MHERLSRYMLLATSLFWLNFVFFPHSSAQAQGAEFLFPTGAENAGSDNPQYRIRVWGGYPATVRVQLFVDNAWKWERNVTLSAPTGEVEVLARIPWFPENTAAHFVDVYTNYIGNGAVWKDQVSSQRLSSSLNVRYVVIHYLNESGGSHTMFTFNDLDFFDPNAHEPTLYTYNWGTDAAPDAIHYQCSVSSRIQHRLLATRNHSVPSGCTRIRRDSPDATLNVCNDFRTVFDNIIAGDPNRSNAIHLFAVNSYARWENGAFDGKRGYAPGEGKRWALVIDNMDRASTATVVAHEFGHMAGASGHADDPGSSINDCGEPVSTRNIMCSTPGRQIISSQCSLFYNASLPNLF